MPALHFGIVPVDASGTPRLDGYDDASREHLVDVGGFAATISGSWACWGPAGQETDGDNSLHVVADVGARDRREVLDLAGRIGDALASRLGKGSRLLDYGIVSSATAWSEDQLTFLRYDERLYRPS